MSDRPCREAAARSAPDAPARMSAAPAGARIGCRRTRRVVDRDRRDLATFIAAAGLALRRRSLRRQPPAVRRLVAAYVALGLTRPTR